jgi:hypothetical protein
VASKDLPVAIYSVQKVKPANAFGAPAQVPVQNGESRAYIKFSFDSIPNDATITGAELRMIVSKPKGGNSPVSVRPIDGPWGPDVTWNNQPGAGGAVISTVTKSGIAEGTDYVFDVTSWAVSRPKNGLRMDTTEGAPVWFFGSTAAKGNPKVVVTYTVKPQRPGNLKPDGGVVADPRPTLTFSADEDMTEFQVQYSTDGANASVTTAWTPSKFGRFNPSGNPEVPAAGEGQTYYWRVRTRGPDGTSDYSEWADYKYRALPDVTITAPLSETTQGSPPIAWTVSTSQSAWKVDFYNDKNGNLLESSGWRTTANARSWNPSKAVGVPDGEGRFELFIQDQYTNRVSSEGQSNEVRRVKRFKTVKVAEEPPEEPPEEPIEDPDDPGNPDPPLTDPPEQPEDPVGEDPIPPDPTNPEDPNVEQPPPVIPGTDGGSYFGPTTLAASFSDPVVTVSGTRTVGIPDEVALFRDGVQVTIWDPLTGQPYLWGPGSRFFSNNYTFAIRDYTAPPRGAHQWEVQIRNAKKVGYAGPKASLTLHTDTVWLVNPATGEKVEILGEDGPAVDQETAENAIMHTPVNGREGGLVEPVRRRIVRTTRFGSVQGTVLNQDDDLLQEWVESDASTRYRLVFGKANLAVIVGDYSPVDPTHLPRATPDRTGVSFNWWQRLADR